MMEQFNPVRITGHKREENKIKYQSMYSRCLEQLEEILFFFWEINI